MTALLRRRHSLSLPPLKDRPRAYRVWLGIVTVAGITTATATAAVRPDLWIPVPGQVLPLLFLLTLVMIGEAYHVDIFAAPYGFYVVSPTYNLVGPLLALFTPAALAGAGSALITLSSIYLRCRRVHIAVVNASIDIPQMVFARLLAEAVPVTALGPQIGALAQAAVIYLVQRGISTANVAIVRVTSGYENPRDAFRVLAGAWLAMDTAASILLSGLLIGATEHNLTYLAYTAPVAVSYATLYMVAGDSLRRIKEGRVCSLTGLVTHTVFQDVLRTRLRSGRPVGLVFVDVDHFKQLNDTRGHMEGDRVLREIAQTICGTISISDMAARYGGEEFAVLLTATSTSPDDVAAVGERIRCAVEEKCGVTVSVGTAVSEPGGDPRALLDAADIALYMAKRAGRNRVIAYPQPVRASGSGNTLLVGVGR